MNMGTRVFDRSNIAETPNPKPISVQRVSVRMEHTDDNGVVSYGNWSEGVVKNANIHPAALTGRD